MKKTHSIKGPSAQGDIIITPLDKLPAGATFKEKVQNGKIVLAHSESGHHHVAQAPGELSLFTSNDPRVFFVVAKGTTSFIHEKTANDAHDTLTAEAPVYKITRQREISPEGWRTVAD